MSADFGVHPTLATDLIEVLGVGGPRRVRRRAARGLDGARAALLRPRRSTAPAARSCMPQPKGVIGNISPWNFPFDLSVGPLVEMLAAGNRVVLKPSEHTPACSRGAARHDPRDVRPRPRGRGGRRRRPGQGLLAGPLGPPALHGQPRDRPRDREGGGRAARARHARAGRQVPGDPGRRLDRRRVGQAGPRHEGAQERPDVHLGRLLPGAARADGRLRAPGGRARAREHARLLLVGEQHGDHHEPPSRADPGTDRGRPLARLRGALARGGRRRGRPGHAVSCRCRSCSTRPTTWR